MAKLVRTLSGDLSTVLQYCDSAVNKSISATLEDSDEYSINGVRVATRVYERYSYIGGNRVSLAITAVAHDGEVRLTAITSGGSQALFFKINTFGESSFLESLAKELDRYGAR